MVHLRPAPGAWADCGNALRQAVRSALPQQGPPHRRCTLDRGAAGSRHRRRSGPGRQGGTRDDRRARRPGRRPVRRTARSCWVARRRRKRASGYLAAAAAKRRRVCAANATIPFQPWAIERLANRGVNQLEPTRGSNHRVRARQFLTPYGVEIVDLPELQRVYIFDIGGPHTYRTIYTDGRTHPANLQPAYYGHSIGWWEGDTLVVDTVGFNEGFWMDRRGSPHTEKLHTRS